ncbi:hypothetical protein SUGI_0069390 [Cryptomeria japonica]|nr:hypothetical protein SUGI_0069390 [Cryptomeria japonica]
MEGLGDREMNVITAALIMSSSIMLSVSVLSTHDLHKTNLIVLRAFVILETMAIYSSLAVLMVDLLIEGKGRFQQEIDGKISTVVVLVSLGFSLAGAFLAWSFLSWESCFKLSLPPRLF